MDDVVETVQRSVQYRVHAGARNDVELDCHGRTFQVSEVASRILAKIRDVASDNLGFRVTRAVVTVPAYFTDRQRQAVKEAGKLVGLEVVRIINEPTAAALAYGLGKNLRERVLVYDLGGGTFDVSIIDIRDRVFEVKATAGDIFLGGIDFDNAMIAYVLADFRRKHGVDLSSDPVAMQRIKDLAERTKIDLSSRTEAPFSIPFITMTPQGQPLNIDMRFDRALLEQLTEPLLDRSMEILARVLTDAGIVHRGDRQGHAGGRPDPHAGHPGAAHRASSGGRPRRGSTPTRRWPSARRSTAGRSRPASEQRLQLLDVIPMAIGIEQAGGGTHVVFGRNAAIPNARAISATNSRDGQTELVLRIVQGDHPEAAQQRDPRRVHLQRRPARPGRRGAPGDPLRGERGGDPLGARPRPGHRPRDEDHGAGDAELDPRLRRLLLLLEGEQRRLAAQDHAVGDLALLHALPVRHVVHDVEHRLLEDRPQAARARLAPHGLAGGGPQRLLGEGELHLLELEELLVLLHQRVPGLGEDGDEVVLGELGERGDDGDAPHELGDHPELHQVLRLDVGEQLAQRGLLACLDLGPEAEPLHAHPAADGLLDAAEGAAHDEEDVGGVDLDRLLLVVLLAAARA